jgi:adenylate kinase
MRIGITGVPGSGKTTISKIISEKHNLQYISINDLIEEKNFWTTIDARDDAKVVNMIALKKELQNIPDNSVIEGHLLCEFPAHLDILIILRVPIKLLEKRLTEREYNDFKMKSNIYSELLDYCTDRAKCKYCKSEAKIYELVTSNTIEQNLEEIDQIIKGDGEKFKAPWVNLTDFEI